AAGGGDDGVAREAAAAAGGGAGAFLADGPAGLVSPAVGLQLEHEVVLTSHGLDHIDGVVLDVAITLGAARQRGRVPAHAQAHAGGSQRGCGGHGDRTGENAARLGERVLLGRHVEHTVLIPVHPSIDLVAAVHSTTVHHGDGV